MLRRITTIIFLTSVFSLSCNLDRVEPQGPTAKFSLSNDGCMAPCDPGFTNQSSNATSYSWDFGDGNTSTADNPSHTYTNSGTYQVKLTAKDASNFEDDTVVTVTINSPAVTAAFSIQNDECEAPCQINFTNESVGGDTYSWDFGDGNSSTDENPSHIYESAGVYTVTLTANESGGGSSMVSHDVTIQSATWSVTRGNTNRADIAFSVQVNNDGIFVAGYERSVSDINQLVVYKLGPKGNTIDKVNLNNSVSCYGDKAGTIEFDNSGNLVLMSGMIGYDVLVSRISSGSLSASSPKYYNGIDPQGMTVTSNDEVVICGWNLSSTFQGGVLILDYEARLLRLGSNLDSMWMRPYFDADEGTLYGVTQLTNFQLLATGSVIQAGGGARDALAMKTGSTGFLSDSEEFGGSGSSETGKAILQDSNGDIYMAGQSSVNGADYEPFIAKLNSSLTVVDSKTSFGPLSGTNEIIYDMEKTPDGGFILAGYSWVDGLEADAFLMKLGSDFSYQWHKTYGGTFRDYGYEVAVAPDGGYILVGYTRLSEDDVDMLIIKTDANGNVN